MVQSLARVQAQREIGSPGFLPANHLVEHWPQARARSRETGNRREDQGVGGAGESTFTDHASDTEAES